MKKMEDPAKVALDDFYKQEYDKKTEKAEQEKALDADASRRRSPADLFVSRAEEDRPEARAPRRRHPRAQSSTCPCSSSRRA